MLNNLNKHAKNTPRKSPRVVVVPDPGTVTNRTRLAQYRRKQAIRALNPKATFPLEIYEV
ncbi:hypothetical protein IMCC1989_1086 [gamma proteobacterium IMCC1989]|nr:hypothetical protein IMCC1989_1086 [gamma proteobacterium IMCC1989]